MGLKLRPNTVRVRSLCTYYSIGFPVQVHGQVLLCGGIDSRTIVSHLRWCSIMVVSWKNVAQTFAFRAPSLPDYGSQHQGA